MGIRDLFRNIMRERSEDWIFYALKPEQLPKNIHGGSNSSESIEPDKAYMSIRLRSLRIVNVRKLTRKFFGVIHSFISLPHLGNGLASFQVVTVPNDLKEIDSKNLDRVISVNKPLLGPVPYRGGELNLQLGLFSVETADLAAPFISVVEKMSSVAGVSLVKTAAPFKEPISEAFRLLTGGTSNSILEIGLSNSVSEAELQSGWFLVMRANKNEVDLSNLRIKETSNCIEDLEGKPIKDFPYILFSIEQTVQRPDWMQISELKDAWDDIDNLIRRNDFTEATKSLFRFRRLALISPDLISSDGKLLFEKAQKKVSEVLDRVETSAVQSNRSLPDFATLDLYNEVE